MENTERTRTILHRLHELGVRISLDDFGTGYSSLSNLRGFSFDKIKIDQSFVQALGRDNDALAIVEAVIGLGARLNTTTTAEGVETQDQLEWLRAMGVTEVQGYFIARPMPAGNVATLLSERGAAPASCCLISAEADRGTTTTGIATGLLPNLIGLRSVTGQTARIHVTSGARQIYP